MHFLLHCLLIIVSLYVVLEILSRVLNRIGKRIEWREIDIYVEKIMRAGENGGSIILRADGHQVGFAKEISSSGTATFSLVIRHRIGWDKDVDDAERYLVASGQTYEQNTNGPFHIRCLVVNIGRDVELGSRLSRELMHSAFSVPENARLNVSFIGPINVREGAVVGWKSEELEAKVLVGEAGDAMSSTKPVGEPPPKPKFYPRGLVRLAVAVAMIIMGSLWRRWWVVICGVVIVYVDFCRYGRPIYEFMRRERMPQMPELADLPESDRLEIWRRRRRRVLLFGSPLWLLLVAVLWFVLGAAAVLVIHAVNPSAREYDTLIALLCGFPAATLVFFLTTLVSAATVSGPPPGICLKCGYDLRATPDRCPECGHVPPGKTD